MAAPSREEEASGGKEGEEASRGESVRREAGGARSLAVWGVASKSGESDEGGEIQPGASENVDPRSRWVPVE